MAGFPPVIRTIVEDKIGGVPTFRNELLAIEPDARKADDLLEGALFVLRHDPSQGVQNSPHSLTWYFEILKPHRCILYYTFDVKEVLLVSIQRR